MKRRTLISALVAAVCAPFIPKLATSATVSGNRWSGTVNGEVLNVELIRDAVWYNERVKLTGIRYVIKTEDIELAFRIQTKGNRVDDSEWLAQLDHEYLPVIVKEEIARVETRERTRRLFEKYGVQWW